MTHYDTLEISPQASAEVVRAAYRSLIQRFHPDRNPGDESAGARAVAITQAYEVLSDAERRGAYDRQLLTEAARAREHVAPMAPRRRQSLPSVSGRASGSVMSWRWAGVALAVIAGAAWLGKNRENPSAELASIQHAFASANAPQAQRQQLFARKEDLLHRHPELRLQSAAETARERAARTMDLLDAPLVVQSNKHELVIPRISLVLGTFDARLLRRRIDDRRALLVEAIAERLASDPRLERTPVANESYLREVVAAAINHALGARLDESFPSTYFESPGRYGVVDVALPDRFDLRLK